MPSVDFLKIAGTSASVNEKLMASIGTVKLAASTHATANNYFKNVNSVLARRPSLKGMTNRYSHVKTTTFMGIRCVFERNQKFFRVFTCLIIKISTNLFSIKDTIRHAIQLQQKIFQTSLGPNSASNRKKCRVSSCSKFDHRHRKRFQTMSWLLL